MRKLTRYHGKPSSADEEGSWEVDDVVARASSIRDLLRCTYTTEINVLFDAVTLRMKDGTVWVCAAEALSLAAGLPHPGWSESVARPRARETSVSVLTTPRAKRLCERDPSETWHRIAERAR
jgi:hypothetical protein